MFSVENFYYVIYTHLLIHGNFRDYFFYPFGTTNLIVGYFKNQPKSNTCLFYDQEPILENIYNQVTHPVSLKRLNLLANSEHSTLKSRICQAEWWNDWYYFYHGFAAMDWFRDCKYFPVHDNWQHKFISFNRLCTGDRAYRLHLVSEMIDNNIDDQGLISLHINSKDNMTLKEELFRSDSWLDKSIKIAVYKNIKHDHVIDLPNILGSASAGVGPQEWKLWQSSLLHVVTETVFYHEKQHLTEKIFKPIVAGRPFMLVAATGNLEYLRGYGFKTFDRWISEDYDLESDAEKRIWIIVQELKKFISQPEWKLREIYQEMLPILEHNRQHFWTDFKNDIVDELVDNFETCIRIWNNCRVDGREINLDVYNFNGVKKLFLS